MGWKSPEKLLSPGTKLENFHYFGFGTGKNTYNYQTISALKNAVAPGTIKNCFWGITVTSVIQHKCQQIT